MVGQVKEFKGIVGTSIMKFFNLSLGKTGLSEQNIRSFISMSHIQQATDIAGYFPG